MDHQELTVRRCLVGCSVVSSRVAPFVVVRRVSRYGGIQACLVRDSRDGAMDRRMFVIANLIRDSFSHFVVTQATEP